jgi:hypothetical protein
LSLEFKNEGEWRGVIAQPPGLLRVWIRFDAKGKKLLIEVVDENDISYPLIITDIEDLKELVHAIHFLFDMQKRRKAKAEAGEEGEEEEEEERGGVAE